MRTALLRAISVAMVLGFPAPGGAEEITFGVFSSLEYDSNIFNTKHDETDDVAFRVGTSLSVERPQGDLTYLVRYEPRWESYIDESGLDAWDHNVHGRFNYRLGPRTEVYGEDTWFLTRSLNRRLIDATDTTTVSELDAETRRQRIKRNRATLGMRHAFTERFSGELEAIHTVFRTNADNRFDSDTIGATASVFYLLTERQEIGGGFGTTYQDYDDTDTQPGEETYFYRLFGSWTFKVDPTLTFSLTGGPTYIDSETDNEQTSVTTRRFPSTQVGGSFFPIAFASCPALSGGMRALSRADCANLLDSRSGAAADPFRQNVTLFLLDPQESDESRLTFFGGAEITKRWENLLAVLAYRRQESGSSGLGTSVVLDLATLRMRWAPSRVWSVNLLAEWAQRKSATDQTGNVIALDPALPADVSGVAGASEAVVLRSEEFNSPLDITNFRGVMRIQRRFGKRTRLFGVLTYLNQHSSGEASPNADFDDFRFMLGVRYDFDPLHV